MNQAAELDLAVLLPAGEWSQLKVVPTPDGMMAERRWAILARARWVRGGGKPAFIKFIRAAEPTAGKETDLVTNEVRLKQLQAKLEELQKVQDWIPIVEIFEVSLTTRGLLLAMEDVRVLQSLIDQGDAEQYAVPVLRTFAARGPAGKNWLHLDICPKNIGVRANGNLALIDLDSVYLESATGYLVTVPAWKPFRAPDVLCQRVHDGLIHGKMDLATAVQKVRFEILLAATECVFGALPVEAVGQQLDKPRLDRWLASAEKDDPVAALFKKELEAAIKGESVRELTAIAADVEQALIARSNAVARKVVLLVQGTLESTLPVIGAGAEHAGAFDVQWVALKPSAHALRAGKLNRQMIAEYRRALEACLEAAPDRPELWEELLLVLISYEKDARAAWTAVSEALKHLPDHRGLLRMRDVVRPWVREVSS